MCFSATASFIVGGALAGTSVAALNRANKTQRLFALIPLFFGIQQIIEGFQWVAVNQSAMSDGLAYAYLFFALLFWPVYIPLAVMRMEKQGLRKSLLALLLGIGLLVSSVLLLLLLVYGVEVIVGEHPIIYSIPTSSSYFVVGTILYSMAVVGSLLASSYHPIPLFGILILLLELLSIAYFPNGFVSVWCFFAAVSSLAVYGCFHVWRKKGLQSKKGLKSKIGLES